jgi:hypothetical protein
MVFDQSLQDRVISEIKGFIELEQMLARKRKKKKGPGLGLGSHSYQQQG